MLATTQLTIRGLRVYHVTRYLSRNYILSKRCCPPTDPYTYTRVARTVNEEHEPRGGGQDPLPFPFLVPRTGNRHKGSR